MGEDAPELSSVALYFDEGAAKLGLFRPLGQRLLEQASKTVLLALNPEDVLHFLPGTRARNLGVQEQASHDFVSRQPARSCEVFEVDRVRIRESHSDPLSQIPHPMSISIAIALSRRNVVSDGRISRRR